MTRPGFWDYASAAGSHLSLIVAAVVGVVRWRRLSPAYRGITMGFCIMSAMATIQFILGRFGIYTRSVDEIQSVIVATVMLGAFAYLQPTQRARQVVYVLIPVFAVVWLVLWLGTDHRNPFSPIITSLHDLILVGVAAVTLVSRGWYDPEPPVQQPWFWALIGCLLIFGSEVVLHPLGSHLFGLRDDLILLAYMIHALLTIVGSLMVVWGLVLAGRSRRTSGGVARVG
jgi:hypothetical protein